MPDESLILKPADAAGNAFVTLYENRMKSLSPFVLPANAAKRLLEIANAMEAPHGFIEVGQLNRTFLNEGGSSDEYRAGIAKLKADGLIDMHPSGARLTFTDKGAQRFA